jgi:hypothetical protein
MYALNIKKGTNIYNPDIGDLPGGVAIPITEKQSLIAKHLINVVVFSEVAGVNYRKNYKEVHGLEVVELKKDLPTKTYSDFMSEYKNTVIAGKKWEEYKKEIEDRKNVKPN